MKICKVVFIICHGICLDPLKLLNLSPKKKQKYKIVLLTLEQDPRIFNVNSKKFLLTSVVQP